MFHKKVLVMSCLQEYACSSGVAEHFENYHFCTVLEACLKDIKARVIFNPETKMVDIQLTWSVKISCKCNFFEVFLIHICM